MKNLLTKISPEVFCRKEKINLETIFIFVSEGRVPNKFEDKNPLKFLVNTEKEEKIIW